MDAMAQIGLAIDLESKAALSQATTFGRRVEMAFDKTVKVFSQRVVPKFTSGITRIQKVSKAPRKMWRRALGKEGRKELKGLGREFSKLKNTVNSALSSTTGKLLGFTTAAGAATATVEALTDMEGRLSDIRKELPLTTAEAQKFRQAALDIRFERGVSRDTAFGVLQYLGRAKKDLKDSNDLVTAAIDLSILTGKASGETAEALARLQDRFAFKGSERQIASMVVALGDQFHAGKGEVLDFTLSVAESMEALPERLRAKALPQMAAVGAAMFSAWGDPQIVRSSMQGILDVFETENAALRGRLTQIVGGMGKDLSTVIDEGDFETIFRAMHRFATEIPPELLKNRTVLQGMYGDVGDLVTNLKRMDSSAFAAFKTARKGLEDSELSTRRANESADRFGKAWQRIRAAFEQAIFTPAFQERFDEIFSPEKIKVMVESTRDWIKENRGLITGVVKFAAAMLFIGKVVVPIGKFFWSTGKFLKGLATSKAAKLIFGKATWMFLWGIIKKIGGLLLGLNPWVLAIGAAVGLIWTNWETVWNGLKSFGSWMGDVFGPVWEWVKGVGIAAWEGIAAAGDWAWDKLKSFGSWLVDVFGGIWDWVKEKAVSSLNWIIEKINWALRQANKALDWIGAGLPTIPTISTGAGREAPTETAQELTTPVPAARGGTAAFKEALREVMTEHAKYLVRHLAQEPQYTPTGPRSNGTTDSDTLSVLEFAR